MCSWVNIFMYRLQSHTAVSKAKQLKKQSVAKMVRDSVCSLTLALCYMATSMTERVFFCSSSLSQQKNQGLILFICGLTWGDHLLLRTLKHKLADPLVSAIRKRITEGGSGGGVPQLMSCMACIEEPFCPSPRGQSPSSLHICLHTTQLNRSR